MERVRRNRSLRFVTFSLTVVLLALVAANVAGLAT